MTEYAKIPLMLSENQLVKIKSAIRNNVGVAIQVGLKNIKDKNNIVLSLTKRQVDKINSLSGDKMVRLNLSMTQLKSDGGHDLVLNVTPNEIKKIDKELTKLMVLDDYKGNQLGSGIGAIFKLALPFVKKVLPKVLGTVGLSALGGITSGLTHKATKGKGLRRVGGKIKLNKDELRQIMELGNACKCHNIVDDKFIGRMNNDIKKQSGGFLGALLGTLAATILPSLLGGKGIKRAGD